MLNSITRLLARTTVVTAIAVCAAGAQAAPEEITYLLPGPPSLPAFAPWILAQYNGYYADENLKVNFVVAKGGVDVAKQVGAGNAVVGGAIGDTPIIVRANDVPVRAVAVLGGGSLTRIAVHDGSDIKSVKDLKGKTVTVMSYTDTTYYAMLGALRSAGLPKTAVNAEAAGPSGVWQLFVAGKSDAMATVPDWVISAQDAGAKVRLLPKDSNFQSMAQAIIVSDETIKTKPELVKRLVHATLRGMQYIMKDPKAAAAAFVKAVPSAQGKEASMERVLTMYRDDVYGNQKVLGEIDRARMDAVQKFYVSEGIVSKATPVNELFTNKFIGVER